jgi:hypothetical protein
MPTDRPNTNLARAVDEALTMSDVRTAAAFLAGHGAGFALICRVLAEPARRRAAGSPVAPATLLSHPRPTSP